MENARSIILFSGIDRSRFRNHWKCFRFDKNQLKRNRTFHTPQNFLLANLASADITNLTFCAFSVIPMVTVLPDGVVGTILCKFFVGFNVPITAIVAPVFTLTVPAVERYNAVARPLQMLQVTRKTVRYAITGTWVASIALSVPLFANTDYKYKEYCKPLYSSEAKLTHITFVAIFLFIIPFIVISFCYGKIVRTVYNRSTVTPESDIPDKDKLRQRKQLLKMSTHSDCCICSVCWNCKHYVCSSLFRPGKQGRAWIRFISALPKLHFSMHFTVQIIAVLLRRY